MSNLTDRRFRQLIISVILVITSIGVVPLSPSSVAYACYTWQLGSRVGLKKGAEIRTGSGFGFSGTHPRAR